MKPISGMAQAPPMQRVAAVDLLRGLVIVIMALDHCRDFFTAFPFGPVDLTQAPAALFLTRFITHYCAPVFVFLAGTSAWLHARNTGLTPGALQRFLLTRGLWLVFLEVTWNSFMWRFPPLNGFNLQVLWALGCSMMFLAAILRLPRTAIVLIGAAIVGGHDLLDGIHATDFGPDDSPTALFWNILHQSRVVTTDSGLRFAIYYPLLPWVGVMALGYGFGGVLEWPRERREWFMRYAGLAALALFLALRLDNGYGEPDLGGFGGGRVFEQNPRGPLYTWLGLFNVGKYPPSLQFLLLTLGPALLLMPLLERWRGPIASFFTVFGRVPMFFYLLHIPLIRVLSGMSVQLAFGTPATEHEAVAQAYGHSLWQVYLAWFATVAILYPACRWYAGYKQRHREQWWLSYL